MLETLSPLVLAGRKLQKATVSLGSAHALCSPLLLPSPNLMEPRRPQIVFLHSSDELYGADRMLLEMVDAAIGASSAASIEVWLPTDLGHPPPKLSLCHALAQRGVHSQHLSIPIVRRLYLTPRGVIRLLLRVGSLYRQLRLVRPDVLYCTTSAAFLGAPVARVARVPRVVGHVQEVWSRGDTGALSAAASCCNLLLAISTAAEQSLPPSLRGRARVVPNGVPQPQAWTSLEGRTGGLRFLIAGRWNGMKGHRTLLQAWEAAGAPGTLVILGGPPRSGSRVDVPELVAALKHPESVQVVGEVEDPSPYVDESDVMVIPSTEPEGFGLVAIEAFARGRPVIASADGGLLDIVTQGADGWLVPPGDVAALTRLLGALKRDAVARAGAQARQTYENRFTAERFAQSWRAAVLGD